MGRPRKENPRSKGLRIRMTEEDINWIKARAERCGVNASELVRTAVYNYIFRMDPKDVSAIADRVYERGAAS